MFFLWKDVCTHMMTTNEVIRRVAMGGKNEDVADITYGASKPDRMMITTYCPFVS